MAKEIFRKKNLDKVNSPEDLNSYLRVTSPSLLIALGAAVILIGGAVVWGTVSKIETKTKGEAYKNSCYILDSDAASVTENKSTIKVGNKQYKITGIGERVQYNTLDKEVTDQHVFADTDYVVTLSIDTTINYAYPCDVVLKSVSPLEFLFKNS